MLKARNRLRTKLMLKSETIQHLHTSQLQYINGAQIYSPEPECSEIHKAASLKPWICPEQ